MALPNKIQVNAITGASVPNTIDNDLNTGIKQPILDIFGIPDNTNINNAVMEVAASGLTNIRFRDAAANPATAGYLQRNAATLNFYDGTANRILVSRDATETLSNKTLVSPAVTTGPITLTSGQIAFPATQAASADANTLDDYEEGTWTPSVGGTATYLVQSGRYTKIGRLVVASFNIQINAIGTGSQTTISGLPFADATIGGVGTCYWSTSATNITTLVGRIPDGGSTIVLWSATAAASSLATNNIFQASTSVQGIISYMAAT